MADSDGGAPGTLIVPERVSPGEVFISYSHSDRSFAFQLRDALINSGKSVWIDQESIPGASRWADDLRRAIEDTECFVFVMSPDSVISAECLKELSHATSLNKRIIPLLYREVEIASLPDALASRQFVPSRGTFELDPGMSVGQLIGAIDTDLEWLREHTAWGRKAIEWHEHGNDHSFLLSGNELVGAEDWLSRAAGKDPVPTALQSAYVLASRRAASRRQRKLLFGVSVALVVALVLAVVALVQRNTAVSNEQLALSRQIAADAESYLGSDPGVSAILAIRSIGVRDTAQGESALRSAVPELQILRTWVSPGLVDLNGASFSASGSEVVATSTNGTATIFSSVTGRTVRVLTEPGRNAMTSANFNPTGTEVVTSSDDGSARVWSVATGKVLNVFHGPSGYPLSSASFVPGLNDVMGTSLQGTAPIWNSSGAVVATYGEAGLELTCGVFSKDRSELALGSEYGRAVIYSASKSEPTVVDGQGSAVSSVEFNPSGKRLITADGDGTAVVWNVSSGARVMTIGEKGGPVVVGAAFNPDGTEIATAGHDGVVRTWDATTGNPLLSLEGHVGVVNSVAFSVNGRELATSGVDGTVRIWDPTPREATIIRREPGGAAVLNASFSPNGAEMASSSEDGTARIWSSGTGKLLCLINEPVLSGNSESQSIATISFSPSGKEVVTTSGDGTARIWSVSSCSQVQEFAPSDHSPLLDASFNPGGTEVATASQDGTATVWSAATGQSVESTASHSGEAVYTVAFSSNGLDLLTASGNGEAQIWDLSRRTVARSFVLPGHASVFTAAFNVGETDIVTASADGRARVWEVASGRLLVTLANPDGALVSDASFSPSGQDIVTASDDGTARVWSLANGSELTGLGQSGDASVISAEFGGNDDVVTADEDGQTVVWSTELAGSIGNLEKIATSRDNVRLTPSEQAAIAAAST